MTTSSPTHETSDNIASSVQTTHNISIDSESQGLASMNNNINNTLVRTSDDNYEAQGLGTINNNNNNTVVTNSNHKDSQGLTSINYNFGNIGHTQTVQHVRTFYNATESRGIRRSNDLSRSSHTERPVTTSLDMPQNMNESAVHRMNMQINSLLARIPQSGLLRPQSSGAATSQQQAGHISQQPPSSTSDKECVGEASNQSITTSTCTTNAESSVNSINVPKEKDDTDSILHAEGVIVEFDDNDQALVASAGDNGVPLESRSNQRSVSRRKKQDNIRASKNKKAGASASQLQTSDNSDQDQNLTNDSCSDEEGSFSMESSEDEDKPSPPTTTMSKKAKARNNRTSSVASQKQKPKRISKEASGKGNSATKRRQGKAAAPVSKRARNSKN